MKRSVLFMMVAGLLIGSAQADILYVTNSGANTVSRVEEGAGTVTTFATGLNDPFGIVLAPNGNFYVANQANLAAGTISQITPNGVVTTFANIGLAPDGMVVDGSGNLYAVNFNSGSVSKVPTTGTAAGTVTTFTTGLDEPTGIALSPGGVLYVSEAVGNIYTLSASGSATLFAAPGENPTGMAFDSQSNLYVSLLSNGVLDKYPEAGGGPIAFASNFSLPEGLAFDSAGNLIVANLGNGNGGGSSSAEISLVNTSGSSIQNITGFTDPAYVVDLSGSATVTPSSGSNGVIVPNTPQTVAVGTGVSFTATPANGFTVDQWILNGVIAQTSGTMFTIQDATPNDTVQVTFKAVGPITPFPGVYIGLLSNNAGTVTINLTAKGSFTGKLTVGSAATTLKGQFTTLGAFPDPAKNVSLQLNPGQPGMPGSFSITGTAAGDTLTAWHAAQSSLYTLTLTPGQGAGIPQTSSTATLTVSDAGKAIFAGKLPDGQSFTTSTVIVGGLSGNQCLFYAILDYKNATPANARGFLIGAITFPSGVVTGPLLWVKPAQTKGQNLGAFTTDLTISQ